MKKNKNGFTLVELLAVIVILAIILVIAVPQIMNVIKDTTKASFESSAKMVASQVENQYTVAQTLGKEFGKTGSCMEDWAGLNDVDYESCTYEIDEDGNAQITLVGKGKFKDLNVCSATRSSASAIEERCKISVTAKTFSSLCKDPESCAANNLLRDIDGNIRYYGSNPNNYISFNNEVWRIIGVFDVKNKIGDADGTLRMKIVRNDMLNETRVFDSVSKVWLGSDLEVYLNGTTEGNYYYNLSSTAKSQISKAVWNTGALIHNSNGTSPSDVYIQEKTIQNSESVIGLISVSDFGYAGGSACTGVELSVCGANSWLNPTNGWYWSIIPFSNNNVSVWYIDSASYANCHNVAGQYGVRPSVYLNAEVKLTGTGENTEEGIYRIS